MTNILIVCTNQPIAETIARLIDQMENWRSSIALSLNDALEHCYAKTYGLVLIGSGVTQEQEDILKLHLERLNASTIIVKHYGGGSGLLYAEIYQALAKSD